ncbi:AsnC family transcriptional regulator [Phyllobacterium brassicacearum]|uniref:AsnC family transcriptional regulator n=1 Tax=Phyllobacterium brassicacearum TaxID=314235 RepID=A0A2P7BRL5_9HYPH|nr:Lrp/AsnC family transcriptional regulator [Phyllobacterium brassicacearum]PSH69100.1 AsnC family transcriptional regulator [Phyllobacterium brassicacearum]
MKEDTNDVRGKRKAKLVLDAFDRKILGALVEDAGLSYARIGERAGLSAPAVFERVKRLRSAGVIESVTARLDGESVGKPLLAFVHVDTTGWGKSERLMRMGEFPEVEEMHSVAGDTGMILKVRTQGPQALEHLLLQLYVIPGVTASRSYVVLSTYLDRPVQADVTLDWPKHPLPKE